MSKECRLSPTKLSTSLPRKSLTRQIATLLIMEKLM